tara:strand:- start:143 stop:721 length:579 start_codon:yes stop_codon:yes gene_type:complete
MANRYVFNSTLEGFINVYEDSGKFNNRCFAYKLSPEALAEAESDREELLKWAKSKATGRVQEAFAPWNDEGVCKYSYGAGDGQSKPKPEPIFVDSEGDVIDKAVLRDVRKGTKVRLIVQQKPYSIPQKVGTSMRVLGVQIIELATGNGSVDSGDLSVDDVNALFGKVEGYKASEPAVRKAEETTGDGESYDF